MIKNRAQHSSRTIRQRNIGPQQQRGAISILFASSLIIILSVIIMSANFAYLAIKQSRLDHAIESAVVAIGLAGNGTNSDPLSHNDYRDIVTNILIAMFPKNYKDIDFTINPPENSGDPYTITAEMKSNYIASDWLAWQKFETNSEIKLGTKIGVDVVLGNIEIALIMDNSGSMYTDIDTLKDSAVLFVNQLMDDRSHDEQVYISLVPFSYSVNIGPQNLSWISSRLSPTARSLGACVNYRYNNPPANEIITNAILPPLPVAGTANKKFPGYSAGPFAPCAETPLLGLTNNKSLLLNKINDMVASGDTDGDQGILWGWRTLTEKWQGLWPSAVTRPLAKTEVKKVALFFSDGASIQNETEIFLPICTAMKKDGIEIYTIQFSSANNSMKACASNIAGKQHYFYANNQQQLKQAFIDISQDVGFELTLKKL